MTGADAALQPLGDALGSREAPLRLWWRDDDAGPDEPALGRLLRLAEDADLPLALAVVPAWLEEPAAARIARSPVTTVLQHGWDHTDHARPGERKVELGGRWAPAPMRGALERGCERLRARFSDRFLPVMVPPWNRFRPDVPALLAGLGYAALSGLRGRPGGAGDEPLPLPRVDVTFDPMDWTVGGRWRGLAPIASALARAIGTAGTEPIGLMTHHRRMESGDLIELAALLRFLRTQSCVQMVNVRAMMTSRVISTDD